MTRKQIEQEFGRSFREMLEEDTREDIYGHYWGVTALSKVYDMAPRHIRRYCKLWNIKLKPNHNPYPSKTEDLIITLTRGLTIQAFFYSRCRWKYYWEMAQEIGSEIDTLRMLFQRRGLIKPKSIGCGWNNNPQWREIWGQRSDFKFGRGR